MGLTAGLPKLFLFMQTVCSIHYHRQHSRETGEEINLLPRHSAPHSNNYKLLAWKHSESFSHAYCVRVLFICLFIVQKTPQNQCFFLKEELLFGLKERMLESGFMGLLTVHHSMSFRKVMLRVCMLEGNRQCPQITLCCP